MSRQVRAILGKRQNSISQVNVAPGPCRDSLFFPSPFVLFLQSQNRDLSSSKCQWKNGLLEDYLSLNRRSKKVKGNNAKTVIYSRLSDRSAHSLSTYCTTHKCIVRSEHHAGCLNCPVSLQVSFPSYSEPHY